MPIKKLIMTKNITVQHVSIKAKSGFDSITKNLENVLGKLDLNVIAKLREDPKFVEKKIKSEMQGAEDLILFGSFDHGALLGVSGKASNAMQYVIGNPLIANLMTQHDIRAGLYAPLRVLIFENPDKSVQIEYDLPSSLFGQFGIGEIDEVAVSLDQKLERLIKGIDRLYE
jgi:uncharacterized protein (DUF302 family)